MLAEAGVSLPLQTKTHTGHATKRMPEPGTRNTRRRKRSKIKTPVNQTEKLDKIMAELYPGLTMGPKNTYPDLNWSHHEGPPGPEQAHDKSTHVNFISHAKMEHYLKRNPIEKEGVQKLKDNVDPHLKVTVNPDL